MLCFEKFPVTKAFMDKTGVSKFSVEKIYLIVPKIFGGEFCCVSIVWDIGKLFASEGYLTFFRGFFCLTVSNTIVGEPSSAVFHKSSVTEKVYG